MVIVLRPRVLLPVGSGRAQNRIEEHGLASRKCAIEINRATHRHSFSPRRSAWDAIMKCSLSTCRIDNGERPIRQSLISGRREFIWSSKSTRNTKTRSCCSFLTALADETGSALHVYFRLSRIFVDSGADPCSVSPRSLHRPNSSARMRDFESRRVS